RPNHPRRRPSSRAATSRDNFSCRTRCSSAASKLGGVPPHFFRERSRWGATSGGAPTSRSGGAVTVRLLDALDDRQLLAESFAGPTWNAWRVFLRALDAEPMDTEALAVFQACTGRTVPPDRSAREAVAIVGRRGGKSGIAAALAVEAAVLRDWRPVLARGERAVIAIISADRQQSGIVRGYCQGLLAGSPLLRQRLVRETDVALDLTGRVSIEVTTNSARTTRGYTFALVICDELAFWRSETSSEPDVEVLAAVRP